MKVLMIGWEYPPHNSGGLGVACQGIVENLVDQGEDVVLVLPSANVPETGEESEMITPTGKKYRVIFVHSPIHPYLNVDSEPYDRDLIHDVELFARKVLAAINNEDFDLVHVHDWLGVPAGIRIKQRTGKPLVMHVHSTEFDRTAGGDPNLAVRSIEQSGFDQADMIFTVSKYTKSLLTGKYNVPEEKIKVVHNGNNYFPVKGSVSIDFLKNNPVVIFVGRLTIQKGPDYFIDLARKVLRVRPDTIFVFAGNGDMYQHLMLTSAYHQLSGNMLFAGFLRDSAKDRLYQRADVFVMPSVSEPFGIVALEAAIAGVPVIVSKTSGVSEVLPSAIKLDFWDTDMMAKSILKLIGKTELKRQLGNKVKGEAGAVTWDKAAMKIKENYQRLFLPAYA